MSIGKTIFFCLKRKIDSKTINMITVFGKKYEKYISVKFKVFYGSCTCSVNRK